MIYLSGCNHFLFVLKGWKCNQNSQSNQFAVNALANIFSSIISLFQATAIKT